MVEIIQECIEKVISGSASKCNEQRQQYLVHQVFGETTGLERQR